MRRGHVLAAVTAVATLCFALPAVGATSSPLKTAKSALGLAKTANKNAKAAKTTATSAKKNALLAKSSASSAGKKAQSALDALKKPVASAVTAGTAVTATHASTADNATNATHAGSADTATHANAASSADNVVVLPVRRVDVTGSAATAADARAAATEVPLVTQGSLAIYAKCFKDTAGPTVHGELYVRTTADRATFNSSNDDLYGGAATDFLNTDTAEDDRQIDSESVGADSAYQGYPHDAQFLAIAADRSVSLGGDLEIGVKQGTLAGGDGPYGPGDGCLFGGQVRIG